MAANPGALLNAAIERVRHQAQPESDTAKWLHFTITTDYKINRNGGAFYVHLRNRKPLTKGQFGEKKGLTSRTFPRICKDADFAATFRDEEIAEAARVYAETNFLNGWQLHTLNDALVYVLAANHGVNMEASHFNRAAFLVLPNRDGS